MNKLRFIGGVLIIIMIMSYGVAWIFSEYTTETTDKIAVIPIKGEITLEESTSFLGSSQAVAEEITEQITKANNDPHVKAILLDINSPGGTVVASQEIAEKVKQANKPTVAVIREVGASGGYWIASAADTIIASPMSITGSIGVLGSYIELSGLFEKYGIEYQRFTGGRYKDLGTPLKEPTEQERVIFQKKIDAIHEFFIHEVAKNRNLDIEYVRGIATGEFYLGQEALELHLIDFLGDKEEAMNYIKKIINQDEIAIVEYRRERGFLDFFTKISLSSSYYIGKGIGDSLKQAHVQAFIPEA